MRIGLIARCDSTGLGVQSKGFFDHIPCKALVIDFSNMMSSASQREILRPHTDRFPGQEVFKWGNKHNLTGDIPAEVIERFISDIDILVAMETPYDYNIFSHCKRRGVKTVLQLNYEFLDFPSGSITSPDLFAAPSMWNYDKIPGEKVYLPVPVNTKHFSVKRKEKTFVHIVGRAAAHDRNGTETFLNSLRYVQNEITVVIRSQRPVAIPQISKNINLITEFTNKENYFDNYDGGVLVLPRKYGGLCLPMNEAIASGMPVITTDISPNNTWLPAEWLVPAAHAGSFKCKKMVDYYEANVKQLARKIDEFCDQDFYNNSVSKACEIRDKISWDTLQPLYMKTFSDLL